MRLTVLFSFSGVLAVLLATSGCTTLVDQPGLPSQNWDNAPQTYHPLQVHNASFVESVHFCDFYDARHLGGPDGWARVLDWAERKKDGRIGPGHTVAVYTLKNKLWRYDIDHGFSPLTTPVESRLDLKAVIPTILGRYSMEDAVMVRYLDELPQPADKPAADYTQGATTMDLAEALQVAMELGKHRPVRVVEFIAPRDSYLRPFAATIFRYGNKLCLYTTWTGARVVDAPPGADINDLDLVRSFVLAVFADAENVKWFQPAKTVVLK